MKRCSQCRESKPTTEFSKSSYQRDGLRGTCKACDRAYRQAHKEQIAARHKAYRETHKEEIRSRSKAYRQTHREEIAAKHKAYREAHKEEIRSRSQRYNETHREERRSYNRAYYYANKEREAARKKAWRLAKLQSAAAPNALTAREDSLRYCPMCNTAKAESAFRNDFSWRRVSEKICDSCGHAYRGRSDTRPPLKQATSLVRQIGT